MVLVSILKVKKEPTTEVSIYIIMKLSLIILLDFPRNEIMADENNGKCIQGINVGAFSRLIILFSQKKEN